MALANRQARFRGLRVRIFGMLSCKPLDARAATDCCGGVDRNEECKGACAKHESWRNAPPTAVPTPLLLTFRRNGTGRCVRAHYLKAFHRGLITAFPLLSNSSSNVSGAAVSNATT